MNMTEAMHVNLLLSFLFAGDSEDERTNAEQAAGYLAGRARRALGTGPTQVEAAARFGQVFPPGWWELPPAVLVDGDRSTETGTRAGLP